MGKKKSVPDYFNKYPTIAFDRTDNGILTVRLHSNNGPVVYAAQHHADWCGAFYDIGADSDNRIVILTGTGDEFMDQWGWDDPLESPFDWAKAAYEARRILHNLLDIEVPVIGAVNGPATIHSELPVMSDIVLASTTATFQDKVHIDMLGGVPGDGVDIVWKEVIGINRARYFLMMNQSLSAQEALQLGVVNEVLEPNKLMPRAMEIANYLIDNVPRLTLRYTRAVMVQPYKRALVSQIESSLALEGLAFFDGVQANLELAE